MTCDYSDYQFKTQPLAHQRQWLEQHSEDPCAALFWEMGCMKSKVYIDNIGYLYLKGLINGALIVAPNGVDLNWHFDEIPKHLPDRISKETRLFRFNTKKSGTKTHKAEVKWQREHKGLAILLMSYDAFMTHEGKEAALLFLEKRECFYGLDESVSIKTPGAKRTMRITRTAYRAKYRRILDGYPTPKGAFDLYSQIKFLDEDFWKRHNFDSAEMFRGYFGVYEDTDANGKKLHNHKSGQDYRVLVGYQHLEELNEMIAPISSRLLKDEVLDLPPKVYEPRYFELTSKQREMYEELLEEYKLWIDKDTLVTANLAIVREIRLQQITCGYMPTPDGAEPVHFIEGKNPRLELLESLIEHQAEPALVWGNWNLDIKLILDMLNAKKSRRVVTYLRHNTDEEKQRAKETFQAGDADFFVSTQQMGGIGLTLHAAQNAYYYTNVYNLRLRKQSEDRIHRYGLKHTAVYTDLLGLNTRDRKIIANLCGKIDTGDAILGDAPGNDIRNILKSWIENETC